MARISPLRAGLLCVGLIIYGASSSQAQFITGIDAGVQGFPILTYDFSIGGDPRFAFVPDPALGNNGSGVEVIGNEIFYTYMTGGIFASDGIHVVDRAGGADLRVFPNPRAGSGIWALSSRDGVLYALTGFPQPNAEIFKIDPTTGQVLAGPIPIPDAGASVANGFVVLPDGRFLIAGDTASCVFTAYDPITGSSSSRTTLRVPGFPDAPAQCTGVATDDESLFFAVDGVAFVQTDLAGHFLRQVGVTSNIVMDISLGPAPLDHTPPHTSAGLSQWPNGAGWNDTPADVILVAVDPSSGVASSGIRHITSTETGAQTASDLWFGATAVLPITMEGTTVVSFHATDNDGNVEDPGGTITVNVDRTPPDITFSGTLKYTVEQTVTIKCSATDTISGIASDTCAAATFVAVPAYTLGVGVTALQATALDYAGNQATAGVTCTVDVTAASLCALQTRFVQSSPNYANLSAAQKSTVNNTLVSMCQTIGKIVPTLTASQKAAVLATYKQALDKFVKSRWLTVSQENTLLALAGRL